MLRTLHCSPLDEIRSWGNPGDLLGRMEVPKRIEDSQSLLAEAEGQGALKNTRRWEPILVNAEQLQP